MDTLQKILLLLRQLLDEIPNLDNIIKNVEFKNKEISNKELVISLREKTLATRESLLLERTHAVEAVKKNNGIESNRLQIKQEELITEWGKMLQERERLDRDKENFSKEKLAFEAKKQK